MQMLAEMTRRKMIRCFGMAGVVLAAAGSSAIAQVRDNKISQQAAKYRSHPYGIQRCEICIQFRPPNRCQLVAGEINPKGWCQYFAAKENAD